MARFTLPAASGGRGTCDLRRATIRTRSIRFRIGDAARCGVVVAAILAHRVPGVTGIYDRSELLDERRAALVAWAAWCERQAEPKGADVLPMRRRG